LNLDQSFLLISLSFVEKFVVIKTSKKACLHNLPLFDDDNPKEWKFDPSVFL
jgi:hypothetical protein